MDFSDDQALDRASEQLRIFRRAAALLSSSLELDQTLANTIAACLPALGDFGFFDAVLDDGVRRTARAHLDAETEALLQTTKWVRQEPGAPNLCALSSGKPALQVDIDDAWYQRVAHNAQHLALLRRLAFRSMLTVPVRYGRELVGALTLFTGRSGRTHGAADMEFAQELASLAAPVVVNVRLLEKQRRAEAALRAGEERLRLATDAGRIGIWDWDIASDRVTWSERVYELHGLAPGQFGGHAADFTQLVHPADRNGVWREIELAIREKESFSADFRAVLPDGRERWLSTWAHLYRDGQSAVTRLVGATIDISERKRVEGRLRFLDAVSEATRGAVSAKAVLEVTARLVGEHLGVTRCAYADLEPDNNRFTIRHDWTVAGVASTVGQYSLDLFGSRAAADMRDGRTLVIQDVDTELHGADGAAMFSAIGIKAIVCCPLVKEGRLLAMMAVHQDRPRHWNADEITLVEEVVERSWAHIERVRATEALRRSEAHLWSLFQQTAAGIAETDLDGRFLNVNERYCQILGRRREEVLALRMQDLTHPDDLARNVALFEKMARQGIPFELEKRYLRPDGSLVWVSVTVSLIRAEGGQPAGTVLAVVLDISERKQAEEKLKDADRRKDEFLAMLAHELRNPLAPIDAAAGLLQLGRLDEERIRKTSEVITRQVRHMTGLVDDLLDVSRVTRGLVTLDKTELDMKRAVAEAVEQVRPLVEARRHALDVQLPGASAFVCADRKRIVQVLVNLLNNAAKYTPDGGSIVLRMEVQGAHVLLEVADNGIGMTPELVGRAFELFAQAERSSDRAQGGLGIGLALVRSLVELHGGSVCARSDGLGRGSRFTIRLPRLLQAAIPLAPAPAGRPGERTNPLKILIVDDNADAAYMLAMYLEASGHTVHVEYGSRRAFERARSEMPDVCLLDIGLPDMDGNELARRLRACPETSSAVLVAVTGYGQDRDRHAAFDAGFNHHFVKPVDAARLGALLAEIGVRDSPA
ncbi:MAG TPA: PAS domain S-box protein [Noviherbaspirillum sp.]|uniref:PAS domain S-box protein n=1 Tax=Noviherbaspirillum sp. TaxID=1926288 RepID=UPI002D5D51A9|nr:PAS domain S-box protein [Noviherbaspirillum sp.]HYD95228.1 PAS domain S-box protein [Noviherbaspirillum sp.]